MHTYLNNHKSMLDVQAYPLYQDSTDHLSCQSFNNLLKITVESHTHKHHQLVECRKPQSAIWHVQSGQKKLANVMRSFVLRRSETNFCQLLT